MKFWLELTEEEEKLMLVSLEEMALNPGEDTDMEEELVGMILDRRHG